VAEVFATCVAKPSYFGSFFFWLDALPSGTLILDLTFVADALFCNNLDGNSALKSGRAGRAGARAGRTVRIIRLIRLVKVYKIYSKAMQDRAARTRERERQRDLKEEGRKKTQEPGGEDGDSDEEEDKEESAVVEHAPSAVPEEESEKETRVGKKLSEMTTRRVIVLVLAMLFGLPQFQTVSHGYDELKTSANLGVEQVYDKWRMWCPANATHPAELPACLRLDSVVETSGGLSLKQMSGRLAEARSWYEKYFLSFVYHHHAGPFGWRLHWVGFQSKSLTDALKQNGVSDPTSHLGSHLGLIGQLSSKTLSGNNSLPSTAWDAIFANPSWVQDIVKLPAETKLRLTSPWTENCRTTFYGVRVAKPTHENVIKCSLDEDLRCSEVEYHIPTATSEEESDELRMVFAFDRRSISRLEAGLSMLQTIFICLSVAIGAMTFSNDANKLLLAPIDRMMSKLECIKDNPMDATRLGEAEFQRKKDGHMVDKGRYEKANIFQKALLKFKRRQKITEPNETVILERTIIKLGCLLALCFGETGGEIVATYMTDGSEDSQGAVSSAVNIMVPGRKMEAIIGFCEMRNLSSVLVTLEEDALLFINRISEFVHEIVDEYHGAPNKNMGCSFLLVWRYDDKKHYGREQVLLHRRKITDMAIVAAVRTIAKLSSCPELAKYTQCEKLAKANNGPFIVDAGFALHAGWAIEGLIGSDHKIDASYVSPHVIIAHTLQQSTPCYGVNILFSHDVISRASPQLAVACRLIDQVKVKRAQEPMRLYTIDLDIARPIEHHQDRPKGHRFKLKQLRDAKKAEKWADGYNMWEEFGEDHDIQMMRARYSPEFFKRFFTAYRNYECGEWLVARDMFYTCDFEPDYRTPGVHITEDKWPEDGPTKTLLKFMQQCDFVCPEDWPGYRDLPRG